MNILDSKTLKAQARQILGETPCDIKKLTLIYCAVAAVLPIFMEILSVLVLSLAPTSAGLADLGKQSIFRTVSTFLSLLPSLLLPFWGVGFLSICVGLVYRQSVTTRDLTAGFRRFWPFLRLFLLIGLIYVGIAFGASLILTIFADPLVSPLASLLNRISLKTGSVDIDYLLSQLSIGELLAALLPALLAILALLLITILPMYYRISMANYILLENPELGAVAAISLSRRLTNGYRWRLLRLDLSFW